MAQKMLLDITTEAPERACIKIDGAAYELRSRDDLGLKEDAEFRALHEEFEKTQTSKNWQEMAAVLDRMVLGAVIGLPVEVLVKLSDPKKLKIVQAFTTEVRSGRAATSPEKEAVAA